MIPTLQEVRDYLVDTEVSSWCEDVVRTPDGRNCVFGHLHAMGKDDEEGTAIWDWFDERWADTHIMFRVNDGKNELYQQDNPRDRCVAYIDALLSGEELSMLEMCARCGDQVEPMDGFSLCDGCERITAE